MGTNKREFYSEQANERLGQTKVNSFGERMWISKYNTTKDIIITFENGYSIHSGWNNWCKSDSKSPFAKTVFGRGYLGLGENTSRDKVDCSKTKKYSTWFAMMQRCYSINSLELKPCYNSCEVIEEWWNFQTFCDWFDKNYNEFDEITLCLDKDILSNGSKLYSPSTCAFIPQELNKLLSVSSIRSGKFPTGVKNNNGKFSAVANKNGKEFYIGNYDTVEEASEAYLSKKIEIIKESVEKYKKYIPNSVYNILISYTKNDIK